ncbi:MAG: hypothetical protein WCJ13_03415 [Coriobacteriia bacterium]
MELVRARAEPHEATFGLASIELDSHHARDDGHVVVVASTCRAGAAGIREPLGQSRAATRGLKAS